MQYLRNVVRNHQRIIALTVVVESDKLEVTGETCVKQYLVSV